MLGHSTVVSSEPLEYGDAGVSRTVGKIRGIVDDAWRDLDTRRFAIDILRNAGAPQYDDWAKVCAIYDAVRNHFYFVLDPVTKEVVMPFPDLWDLAAGDCDEINATAMAVLLGVVGYEPRLVTIAADAHDPESFSHVYVEVFVQGNWIPVDAARPGAQIGVEPPSYFRRAAWSLTSDECWDYPGPGMLDGMRRTIGNRLAGTPVRLHGIAALGSLGDTGYSDPTTGEWIDTTAITDPMQPPIFFTPDLPPPMLPPSTVNPIPPPIDWTKLFTVGVQAATQLTGAALRTPIGPGGSTSIAPKVGTVVNPNPLAALTTPTGLLVLFVGGVFLFMAFQSGGSRKR
jgi:hypothetical protein